ncbi:MAG: gliding motility-associated C-terminal domain-containing protein [Chitinophagaceae bacterium]|nr:gliding motility-associated C-terminal domain-containing protein [Chitinophagaceae bacterium]
MSKQYNISYTHLYRPVLLIAIFILSFLDCARATHIYGADLYYTHVSGNTYTVTLNVYGDCAGSAFPNLQSSSAQVNVFNGSSLFTTLTLLIQNPTTGVEVTPVCASQINNTACNNGSLPGVKKFVYSRTVTLNTTSNNWRFRFTGNMGSGSSAGRSSLITNISSSGSTIMNLEATLNNVNGPNSTATYTTIPTPFFCINKAASYNPGTVDVNSDSLSYSLVPGLTSGGTVTYLTGYSATSPVAAATSTFNFNAQTGQINFTPNLTQQSLVVTQVEEYRNGVLVGTSMREMTYVVLNNCNNNPPGGKITNNSSGKVDTSGVIIDVCKSAGTINFYIDPTDLDTDVINVSYTGLPVGATFTLTNNNTTAPHGVFLWNLTNVNPGNYNFFITYVDDGCPLSSKQTIAYTVKVLPIPDVAVNITSLATCTKKAVFTMTPSVSPSPWRLQVLQGSTVLHNFNGVTGVQTDSLTPGSYTVRVYNADTCFKDTALVIAPPPPIGISLAVTPLKCHNDTNAVVVITASGGKPTYTYAMSSSSFGSNNTFSNLGGGYQTFRIKDQNDCIKDSIIQIVNPLPVSADVIVSQPPCNYYNSGVITISGKNGKSPYLYSFASGSFSATNTFSGLYSGTYAVQVKDSNNCLLDTTVVLPDSIKVHANAVITNILCNGDSTGVITLNAFAATAPYRYKILPSGTLSPVNTFNNLPAITHNFHIEDTNKCYLDTSITLTQPVRIGSTPAITDVLCFGDTTGSISINGTGGVSPYTYAIGTGTYSSANNFSPLSAGTYTIHIKDNNNCLRDTTLTITQPTKLDFANFQITHPTCYGAASGQVIVTATGGVSTYQYAVSTGSYSSVNTFGGLTAGLHTFHIKDNNNCVADSSVLLTQPPRIIPSVAVRKSTCKPLNDGSITINATGGVPGYTYAAGSGSFSASTVFSPLAAGTYIMHVKDQNNCVLDTTIVVADSFILNASASITDAHCYDSSSGIINVGVNGGVVPYSYAIGTGSYGTISAFGGLKANTYTIHIKDNLGCQKDTTLTVAQPTRIVPSLILTHPSCYDYSDGLISISATGGTPGYTNSVDNSPFSVITNFGALAAGTHVVSVKDINNCIIDTTVKLIQPPLIGFSLSISNLKCYHDASGTVYINGIGGTQPYTYTFDSNPYNSNPLQNGISAGQHMIKMKDNNGCIIDSQVVFSEPAPLFITNPIVTNPTCEGYADGSVKVYGNGGVQPYSFMANGGNYAASNTFNGLKEGRNTDFIKDTNDSIYDTTLTLTGYPHITYNSIISEPVSCFDGADGRVSLFVSGGVQPLRYAISGGVPGFLSKFEGLKAGKYQFTVTDNAGCIKDSAYSVESPEKIVVTTKVTPNNCEGVDNVGRIDAFVSGGTPTYKYSWNTRPEQISYYIQGMPNGTYTVTVTDANDCEEKASATMIYDNCCIVFVPDAFTPNNDGLNDLIRMRVKGDFELHTFSIYNRFGQRVFETTNMEKGWDGIYNATQQDIGTYNYFIKGICGNGGTEEVMYKGTITLIR